MYANFAGKQPVGKVSGDAEGRGLDPGFVTGLVVVQDSFESFALAPARVHTEQHLRPVLRFRAASTWMDGDDGVVAIGVAAQQRLRFEILYLGAKRGDLRGELGIYLFTFAGKVKIGGDV